MSQPTTGGGGTMFTRHPSVLCRRVTRSLYLLEGFQWNISYILNTAVDIAGKVFQGQWLRGQRSRSRQQL